MTARAVRVVVDVPGLSRELDYAVPETWPDIAVGSRVRVELNSRRVNAWVVAHVPHSEGLKPVLKHQGFGPPPSMLPLIEWAAWRWAGATSKLFRAVNPPRNITTLPTVPRVAKAHGPQVTTFAPGVWRVAPLDDPFDFIVAAHESTLEMPGTLLVLLPTDAWAKRTAERLARRGLPVAYGDSSWDQQRAGWPIVVGARGAAFSPTPQLRGAVIVDGDDEDYRNEASPTWHAVDVVRERCRRDGAPWWASAVWPSPALRADAVVHVSPSATSGWPRLDVIDRREADPRDGVLSHDVVVAAHDALTGDDEVAVVVVHQRLGAGRLLACRRCGTLARCAQCHQPELLHADLLSCVERHDPRENFCRQCGATNLRAVRSGVTTLARDVTNLLGHTVSEVTSQSLDGPLSRVVVGTSAALYRVRRCGLVIFADFDQYLLAPRASASRQAVHAVALAARLVGPESRGGRVVVQTRRGDDDVLTALEAANFEELSKREDDEARLLGLVPYGARAIVSGESALSWCDQLDPRVRQLRGADSITVEADDITTLCDALGSVKRPPGRLRVAVD